MAIKRTGRFVTAATNKSSPKRHGATYLSVYYLCLSLCALPWVVVLKGEVRDRGFTASMWNSPLANLFVTNPRRVGFWLFLCGRCVTTRILLPSPLTTPLNGKLDATKAKSSQFDSIQSNTHTTLVNSKRHCNKSSMDFVGRRFGRNRRDGTTLVPGDEDLELRSIEEDDPLRGGVIVDTPTTSAATTKTRRKKKKSKKDRSKRSIGDDNSSLGDSQFGDSQLGDSIGGDSFGMVDSNSTDGVFVRQASSTKRKKKRSLKRNKSLRDGGRADDDDDNDLEASTRSHDGIMVAAMSGGGSISSSSKSKKKKKKSSRKGQLTSLLDGPSGTSAFQSQDGGGIGDLQQQQRFLQDNGIDEEGRGGPEEEEEANPLQETNNSGTNRPNIASMNIEGGIWKSNRGNVGLRMRNKKWHVWLRKDRRVRLAFAIVVLVATISGIIAIINRTYVVTTLAPSSAPSKTVPTNPPSVSTIAEATPSPIQAIPNAFTGKVCPTSTQFGPLRCPFNEYCMPCSEVVGDLYICWFEPEPLNRPEFDSVCRAAETQGGRPCGLTSLNCAFGDECVPCNSFAPRNEMAHSVCVPKQQRHRSLQTDPFDPGTRSPASAITPAPILETLAPVTAAPVTAAPVSSSLGSTPSPVRTTPPLTPTPTILTIPVSKVPVALDMCRDANSSDP